MEQLTFSKDKIFNTAKVECMYSAQNAYNLKGESDYLRLQLTDEDRVWFNAAVESAADDMANTISMLFDGIVDVEPFNQDDSSISIAVILQNSKPKTIVFNDMERYLVKYVLKQWFENRGNAPLIAKYTKDFEEAETTLLVRIQRSDNKIGYSYY